MGVSAGLNCAVYTSTTSQHVCATVSRVHLCHDCHDSVSEHVTISLAIYM